MYSFFEGVIDEIAADRVTVDCNGIGYELLASTHSLQSLKLGEKKRLFASLIVREDGQILFGFATKEEKAVFQRLITVSGVGPKVALSVLSTLTASEVATAIVNSDERMLTRAPGLGKKTAQRLILELKGSIKGEELISAILPVSQNDDNQTIADAAAVLMAMGFSAQDSAAAVALVKAEGGSAEQIAMNALRRLDRG